jgi:magnesium-transporting ATPase (P-type)
MKIINFKWFQVIFYYYYLFQGKDSKFAENLTIRMLAMFLSLIVCGILSVFSTLIYRGWVGILILGIPINIYIYLCILVRKMEDTGLTTKITKRKPKIMNSHILSIIFVILFTVFCILVLWGGIELSWIIDDLDIHLIN